jgi:hypothetical protein
MRNAWMRLLPESLLRCADDSLRAGSATDKTVLYKEFHRFVDREDTHVPLLGEFAGRRQNLAVLQNPCGDVVADVAGYLLCPRLRSAR